MMMMIARACVVRSRIERISRVRYNVCVVFAPSSKICEAKRRAIFVTWAFFANGIVFDERGESTWCYILFPKRSAFCNVSIVLLIEPLEVNGPKYFPFLFFIPL